jgi:hypothetical protein
VLELEYQALRDEILALGAAERDAVKFYLPVAALVYAVPYYLLEQAELRSEALKHPTFLWTFVAAVAGLLLLAMLRSILWSVDGSRRLGMYIKLSSTRSAAPWDLTIPAARERRRSVPRS